jgi:hypothetical protein
MLDVVCFDRDDFGFCLRRGQMVTTLERQNSDLGPTRYRKIGDYFKKVRY